MIAQQHSRTRRRLVAGGAVVILGLVIAIVISLINAAGKSADPGGPLVAPASATPGGALAVGQSTALVTLALYLDYMCPFCGQFEQANAAEIERLVADGTARLHLYPLSFLDRMSAGTRYSTRAANAVATVADRAPDKLLAFHKALFTEQPAEGSKGLSDDRVASLARGAGVPKQVVADMGQRRFEPWIAKSTEQVFAGGITGTPTVKINGQVFTGDLYTAGPLTQAITAARGK